MVLPDLNLLLYAYNPHVSGHSRAKKWWEEVHHEGRIVLLPHEITFGFVRILTNPKLKEASVPLEVTQGVVDRWLALLNTRVILPDGDHYRRVMKLMRDSHSRGAILSDAILASYAIHHGAELHSNDTDFARFPDLKWCNPLL